MIFSKFRRTNEGDKPILWDYIEFMLLLLLLAVGIGFIYFMQSSYSTLFLENL